MRDIPEVGQALTLRKEKRERGKGCGGEFFRFREAKSRTLSAKKKFERLRRKRHVVTRVQAAIARREREKLRFSLARRVSPTSLRQHINMNIILKQQYPQKQNNCNPKTKPRRANAPRVENQTLVMPLYVRRISSAMSR